MAREPWLEGKVHKNTAVDVLFWSGGKDSYLALRALERENSRPVLLLTTFDGRSEQVAHQEVLLSQIRRQARRLKLPLLLVPLYPATSYEERVKLGLSLVERRCGVGRLVFGDLHLQHIRTWREQAMRSYLGDGEFELHFPLWRRSYDELYADLEAAGVSCTISAVVSEACQGVIRLGERFTRELMERLPDGVDVFGENGEFHTYVELG